MQMNIALFFYIISCLTGCSIDSSSDKLNILIPERNFSDSTEYRQSKYYRENPVSIMWDNLAFCDYNGKRVNLHINQNNDSLYIYNATDDIDTRLKLPFKISMPIKGLHFHNYDSIFVFFDREFVVKMRNFGNEIDDFIIIDSSANVNGRFLLDEVPYIYNGQMDPMIFFSRASFSGSMIVGEVLYIPFGIYKPNIADLSLKELNIRLLCSYNLRTNEIKMLNVKLPIQDIGKKFNKGVRTNTFDYYILDNNTMYISFLYSSDISHFG